MPEGSKVVHVLPARLLDDGGDGEDRYSRSKRIIRSGSILLQDRSQHSGDDVYPACATSIPRSDSGGRYDRRLHLQDDRPSR